MRRAREPHHVDLLRRAYEAFNARDVEAATDLMAEDVVWPDVADGGFVHGRSGVREHWREQFDALDPRLELLGVEALDDGRLRAAVRQIVRSQEGELISDEELSHVYTIRDGRIEYMQLAE
jgi:ketosteroid isomerase-like protein